jgi:hypothetical protein
MNVKQPPFPDVFNGFNVCWGVGNQIVGPQLLASIPIYSLYKEGTRKRKKAEKEYWEARKKEYNEAKELYDKNLFVGTIFYGSFKDHIAKITKINIEKGWICWKASDAWEAKIKKDNKKYKTQLKPPKPGKISLSSFLSMLKSNQITIVTKSK